MDKLNFIKREALRSDEYEKLAKNMRKGHSFPLRNTQKRSSIKPKTPWHCGICGSQFRSIDGILDPETVATCTKCRRKVCKAECAERDAISGWTCNQCESASWFGQLLNALRPSTNKGWHKDMDQSTVDAIDEDLLKLQKKEREQVRDFIERLVGALLGGDLDNISVKKLYNDEKYDAIFGRYHGDLSGGLTDLGSALHISIANLPISGQSPCSAHASLKLLIQRFIQEAAELPKLRRFEDHPAIPDDSADRTYEDLLSTAIINKVIQNYQEPSSSGSVSSRGSARRDKEYFFGERNLDPKKDDDASSSSSMDSWRNDSNRREQMSLTVQQRIEEVSSSSSSEDEADSKLNWHENWYLQKRKLNGTNSPVPVPMLVPDPVNHAKVLIGDREADDTTDLSDAGSDVEDSIEPSSLNAVLVNSKTIIGGRNPLESLVSKAESISDEGSTDDSDLIQEKDDIVKAFTSLEKDDVVVETTNKMLIDIKNEDNASILSVDSNTEKDSEYTERYASLPRTIYKCPKPAPRMSKIGMNEDCDAYDNKTENGDSGVTSDEDEKREKEFKGTYSAREKEKWNNAIELDNNPYSKSNLERRLSNRSSTSSQNSFNKFFVKEASKPAGSREKAADNGQVANDDIKINDEVVFKAVPVLVTEEPSDSSIEPSTPTRPNHLDISSDSDYSIERTYNLETGAILQKKQELINSSKSPDGEKTPTKDFNENYNMQDRKKVFLRSMTMEEEDVNVFNEIPRNHYKLVDEIANETSGEYHVQPISPPAEYKTENGVGNDFSLDYTDNEDTENDFRSPENEISELKEKQLVKNLRNTFTNVIPPVKATNITIDKHQEPVSLEIVEKEPEEVEDSEDVPSVRRISKIYNNNTSIKTEQVHSLTARSIPKQFRQELKDERTKSNESITEIISSAEPAEEVIVDFPKAKNKIEFFEKLKR